MSRHSYHWFFYSTGIPTISTTCIKPQPAILKKKYNPWARDSVIPNCTTVTAMKTALTAIILPWTYMLRKILTTTSKISTQYTWMELMKKNSSKWTSRGWIDSCKRFLEDSNPRILNLMMRFNYLIHLGTKDTPYCIRSISCGRPRDSKDLSLSIGNESVQSVFSFNNQGLFIIRTDALKIFNITPTYCRG